VGLFKALAQKAGLLPQKEEALFDCLQSKDLPGLRELLVDAPEGVRAALLALPTLYGGVEVLARAREVLPVEPEIVAALDDLQELASRLAGLPISFDLADLRGYHYHSGVVFAAYGGNSPVALAWAGATTASVGPSGAVVRPPVSVLICGSSRPRCPTPWRQAQSWRRGERRASPQPSPRCALAVKT
jgi:ATP phosphoribosyltransferase regulatory subunit